MIKFINFLWEYVIPVFTPFLIYYCAFRMPLTFNIIPEEYVFNLSIAFYSAILVVIKKVLDRGIKEYKNMFSNISVIVSDRGTKFINRYLELDFNSDFVRLFIQIKLNGAPKRLKKKEISIFFPPQVIIQLTESSKRYCRLDDEDKCIRIDVNKLFNANKNNVISGDSATFDIEVSKIDEVVESKAEVSLTKGSIMTNLEKNEIYFKK